ncbi:hypothetical protein RUM43_009065 [Polyplax serrata]|uniref:Uncharacterized protein n=1 Tax=Polyplax serrata TaxID=468196 RepID=A0AAN8PHL4_POLSC
MIKILGVLLAACVLGTLARPQQPQEKEPVPILSSANEASVDGSYRFGFEAGDGTKVLQEGAVKDLQDADGKPTKGGVARGAYSYVGDDGQTYTVTYTADETGFHAEGAHLPVAPPVPEEIQRALEYLRSLPPQEESN